MIKQVGETVIQPQHKSSCHCGSVELLLTLPDGIVNCRLNLRLQVFNNRSAEQGCPVLAPLAVMNHDRHQRKINVLHTQPEALIDAKSAAIENFYNESVAAV